MSPSLFFSVDVAFGVADRNNGSHTATMYWMPDVRFAAGLNGDSERSPGVLQQQQVGRIDRKAAQGLVEDYLEGEPEVGAA